MCFKTFYPKYKNALHNFLFDVFLCCRFRAGVKDLEVMVQNLISSAFETVTTVQEGVEILDIFHHLSTREVRE